MLKVISNLNIYKTKILHCLKHSQVKVNQSIKPKKEELKFETKVPQNYYIDEYPPVTPTTIDEDTISLLEQLSLVDCANKQGIQTLEDAIHFADRILHIKTDNVEPMYTVLENRCLTLRKDEVTDGNCRKDILRNANLTEEDYFIAPPGNIPLQPRDNLLHK